VTLYLILAIVILIGLLVLGVCIAHAIIKGLGKQVDELKAEKAGLEQGLLDMNEKVCDLNDLLKANAAKEKEANDAKAELEATPDSGLAGRAHKLF
jgi:Sec-independent protein translocase protein TatA